MPDSLLTEAIPSAVEERYRLLVGYSPDMVSLGDAEGRFAFASAAHTRIRGYPVEELVGEHPLHFVHPDNVEGVAEELAGARPSAPVALRFRCRDGRYRHVEAVVVDLSDEPSVGGILAASRDVRDSATSTRCRPWPIA